MRVRVSSIVCEELAAPLRDAGNLIERALSPSLEGASYGGDVEQVSAFAVAVEDDEALNEKFCRQYRGFGKYKNPLSEESIKVVSFALPFPPATLLGCNAVEIAQLMCDEWLNQLESAAPKRVPKKFSYERFASELKIAIELLVKRLPKG